MSHKELSLSLPGTDIRKGFQIRNRRFVFLVGSAAILIVAATLFLSAPAGSSTPSVGNSAAIEAEVARWTAIGEHYQAQALNAERREAALVARWTAMGEHYQAQAANAERREAALVARWNAMGEHYQAQAVNAALREAAMVARWNAMGEHYQAQATNAALREAAMIARWTAMGEQYAGNE
jgi:hypothetical protein